MSSSTNWSGPFTTSLCEGKGIYLEGTVIETRVHSVFVTAKAQAANVSAQDENLPTRFCVVTVELEHACDRAFQDNGLEIYYKANALMDDGSKKKVVVTKLSADELSQRLGSPSLPDNFHNERRAHLHPQRRNVFDFFIDASMKGAKDVDKGAKLAIHTRGSSVFVDKFARTDVVSLGKAAEGNEETGAAWEKSITQHVGETFKEHGADMEGAESDEWSD